MRAARYWRLHGTCDWPWRRSCAGRGIDHDVGMRGANLFGDALLEHREGSSVGVSSNWRAFDCTLRGPDDGYLNIYRSLVGVCENYGCSEEERVFTIILGSRVLSMKARTLVSGIRNIRMSNTLDGDWAQCSESSGRISRSRTLG